MDINDNNKFFKWVWRFNALAIAGAAVICFLLGSFLAVKFFMNETRTRRVTNLINVEGASKVKEEFVLGYPSMIRGTDYMRIPLYREQSYSAAYYSKNSTANDVNYLFLNSHTGHSKWLMPTNAQLFLYPKYLEEKHKGHMPSPARLEEKTIGIVYVMAEKDTNGDKRLSDKDAVTISYSLPDGSGFKKLIESIDRVHAIEQASDNNLVIIYEKNKETICETYDVSSMKHLSHNTIPSLPVSK